MLARVLATSLCPPVCLSVSVCHKSEFYRDGWTNRAGFRHGSFLPPMLHCVERKFGYLRLELCPSSMVGVRGRRLTVCLGERLRRPVRRVMSRRSDFAELMSESAYNRLVRPQTNTDVEIGYVRPTIRPAYRTQSSLLPI